MCGAVEMAGLAVRYLQVRTPARACALTESRNPEYLNTLAVAHALLRNFSEAVKTLERAVALARARGDRTLAIKLQQQLDMFKRKAAGVR